VVRNRRVLDVGAGAFCFLSRIALKAGAKSVHAVEASEPAVLHAIKLFHQENSSEPFRSESHSERIRQEDEAAMCQSLHAIDGTCAAFRRWKMEVSFLRKSIFRSPRDKGNAGSGGHCCTLEFWPRRAAGGKTGPSKLQIHKGFSSDVALTGKFDVLVHEILGHVASAEGVALTIADLVERRLCSPDCIFVPEAAGTLFAPTSKLVLDPLEEVLHFYFNGKSGLYPLQKYHVRCFSRNDMMAPLQRFEWLEFNASAEKLRAPRYRKVIFITERDGVFDGLHFHLYVKLDSETAIDTLATETTWSTTYVQLLDPGIWLPAGTRLECDCHAWLNGAKQCYAVKVKMGDVGQEQFLAEYSWAGCS